MYLKALGKKPVLAYLKAVRVHVCVFFNDSLLLAERSERVAFVYFIAKKISPSYFQAITIRKSENSPDGHLAIQDSNPATS
jgi:hypothetical protein